LPFSKRKLVTDRFPVLSLFLFLFRLLFPQFPLTLASPSTAPGSTASSGATCVPMPLPRLLPLADLLNLFSPLSPRNRSTSPTTPDASTTSTPPRKSSRRTSASSPTPASRRSSSRATKPSESLTATRSPASAGRAPFGHAARAVGRSQGRGTEGV
jgi:hypothetical protein